MERWNQYGEHGNFDRVFETISLPLRGSLVPDIKKIYGEQGLWKEVSVGIVGTSVNETQKKVANDLLNYFSNQGHHTYTPSEDGKLKAPHDLGILLAHLDIPDEGGSLIERIPDGTRFVGVDILRQFGIRKGPGHLVGIATIPEKLSEMPHNEVTYAARRFFFRMGVPSAVFISQEKSSGKLTEFTLVTLEGGSISIPTNNYNNALQELRDSLVTLEMAYDLPTADDRSTPFSLEEFESSPSPKTMMATGVRLDQLGYLKAPITASEHTKSWAKKIAIQNYMGTQEWAEAAWLNVDPSGSTLKNIGTIYMTATGASGADKRHLTERDVVPVGEEVKGILQVFPVPGKNTRNKSVEAVELSALVRNSPKIRLKKMGEYYIPDSNGEFSTSIWSSFIHLHLGYDAVDPLLVKHLPPNIDLLPYGVGCGTNLMKKMSEDSAKRAEQIMETEKPLIFIWPVNRHGIIIGVPWGLPIKGKDGKYHQGLETALELIDPKSYGAVRIDLDNIPQFPQGIWP